MWGKIFNTLVEKWDLFPFISFYLKEHGWVYEGFGRWVRRDVLVWIRQQKDRYAMEVWDMTVPPVLKVRRSLDDVSGLSLLFAE